jgi:hypothetical protein
MSAPAEAEVKALVPRHPWTLGDNAPTKRLDSGLALIHVQRDHRETVPHLSAASPPVLPNEVVVDIESEHSDRRARRRQRA